MSMKYIRDYYGVPAKRGAKIVWRDSNNKIHDGVIVGARGQYIRVRIPTYCVGGIVTLHPTSDVRYLPNPSVLPPAAPAGREQRVVGPEN